jgi:hypothetical protein
VPKQISNEFIGIRLPRRLDGREIHGTGPDVSLLLLEILRLLLAAGGFVLIALALDRIAAR